METPTPITMCSDAEQEQQSRDVSASERAFLGAVINGDTRASEHGLRREHFTDARLRNLFALCVRLEAQGKQPDLVTLYDVADHVDTMFLLEITQEAAPQASLASQHAENVRLAALRRRVVEIYAKGIQAAQDASKPLEEGVSKVRAALDRISTQTASSDAMNGEDALVELLTWLDQGDKEKPITTGLSQLDMKLTGGFRGGKLIVVGARPAVGKSALLSSFAVQALKEGRRCLYVSREMSEREIIGRMVSTLSGVSQGKMEARTMNDGDYEALYRTPEILSKDNLWISTKAGTPAAIRRIALRMQAAGGVDLICVDYLQLLQPDVKTNGRVEAVGEISRALKLLAMELGIPVIAAAQVNRASTVGEDRAPKLSELRESGSIEQDADIVFLLHAPQGEEQRGQKLMQLIVAKNRQGRTGLTNLMFDGALMRFTQLEARREEYSA